MSFIRIFALIFSVTFSLYANSQLPSKTLKLEGVWKYKNGGGFEVWTETNGEMSGYAYRVNKVGDTSKVESIVIRKVNKNMMYLLETNITIQDSLVKEKHQFLGGKRKMEFYNIYSNVPYSIRYKYGFLSKNKLKINIQYGPLDKPLSLVLFRVKD